MKSKRRRQENSDQHSTLLLSGNYRPLFLYPLSTVSWKDAVLSVYKDSTIVVSEHPNWVVRSQKTSMLVPSVIAMRTHKEREENVKFSRRNILLRDQYECQYCGKSYHDASETEIQKVLTLDHVIPRSAGGPTQWTNLVCACNFCNGIKGSRLNFKKPKTKPFKPTFKQLLPGYRKRHKLVIRSWDWLNFFEWPESNIIYIPPPDTR